ncbi:hypothetical protein HETIRDRAFT_480543 [Heterobasidion irregulare TC 32-1]|uniref:Piwi domain-containing protein n=1 Tax=Heterobasidion irregulare (strain TC 32-1) TaxID=747525 RepID=W4JS80_HETIT|nr:uncharacterized protein HETIRDRAFT_480543 [Heterobasidion irregulare TC 32-1]ETW76417.1 hypothetical protein HETIRDRAFT_480543 [Heterobasidion irregulare TC 32-1]
MLTDVIRGKVSVQQATLAINILQLFLRQAPMMAQSAFNARSVFSSEGKRSIGRGLELWRGFYQSIRPTVGKMVVNIDTTTSAIYSSVLLPEFAMEFLGIRDVRELTRLTPQNPQWKNLKAVLRNVRITTVVPAHSARRSRVIKDLVPHAGEYEFDKDGVGMIKDYYRQTHQKTVTQPMLFGVKINSTAVIPAEFCQIVKGQIYKKKVPPELMKQVLDFAVKPPTERLNNILDGVRGRVSDPIFDTFELLVFNVFGQFLNYSQSDFIGRIGMQIDEAPMMIQGRQLPSPAIHYGNQVVINQIDGRWNVKEQQFFRPAKLNRWGAVDLSGSPQQTLRTFLKNLYDCCQALGPNPPSVIDQINPSADLTKSLNGLRATHQLNLLVVVLPDNAADLRRGVKVWGDSVAACATQCVKRGKILNANDQYNNNVALKINTKLGGINNSVVSQALNDLRKKPFMVVGADVGHASAGTQRPSITSLVASYDRDCTQYAASIRVQAPRQEIIEHLKEMMVDAINYFGSQNQVVPSKIIFYRDGVSEGEYQQVQDKETKAIQAAFDSIVEQRMIKDAKFQLIFIVVGKRHHIRFFPERSDRRDTTDKSGKMPAGLVVDEKITSPYVPLGDFYLQSHVGLKGTSRPGHYIILQNDPAFSIPKLQDLSYALCHSYARATRSVSIPAPVYYADIVCSRAAFYFEDNLHFDSDVASSSNKPFDLEDWKAGFKKVHANIISKMFFV